MINNYEVFGPKGATQEWIDRTYTGTDWDNVRHIAAALATTPYFWITSKPEDVVLDSAVTTFTPPSPLWTKANQWHFFSKNAWFGTKWSTCRLFNRQAILDAKEPVVSEVHMNAFTYHTGKLPVYFVSKGETNAEENWGTLQRLCPRAKRLEAGATRFDMFTTCGLEAYKDGADHFFLVTGKNRAVNASVFSFTPDPLAPNAHWIFRARNESNGLEYGHMGIGCYSVRAVADTPRNFGLDFTMYSQVIEVPTVASFAEFATTPYEAWRTAFREAVKLESLVWNYGDEIAERRLKTWTNYATGIYAEWVLIGAKDGKKFVESCKNRADLLVHSEDWKWLHSYWVNKYTERQI